MHARVFKIEALRIGATRTLHIGGNKMVRPLLASGQARKLVFAFGLFVTGLNSPSSAAEIKVISVGTVSPVLQVLIPEYERVSGNTVQVSFGNPAVTLERLTKGDPADIVMVAGALWDQAQKLGRLKDESSRQLPTQ
jgi:ABC-type molybdate transport system substrate-binding protein